MSYNPYEDEEDYEVEGQYGFAEFTLTLESDKKDDYEKAIKILNENVEGICSWFDEEYHDFKNLSYSIEFQLVENDDKYAILAKVNLDNTYSYYYKGTEDDYWLEKESYFDGLENLPECAIDNLRNFLEDAEIDIVINDLKDDDILNLKVFDNSAEFEEYIRAQIKENSIMPDVKTQKSDSKFCTYKEVKATRKTVLCFKDSDSQKNIYLLLEEKQSSRYSAFRDNNIAGEYTVRYYDTATMNFASKQISKETAADIYNHKDELDKFFGKDGIKKMFSQEKIMNIDSVEEFFEIKKSFDFSIMKTASEEENRAMTEMLCKIAKKTLNSTYPTVSESCFQKAYESLETCKTIKEIYSAYERTIKNFNSVSRDDYIKLIRAEFDPEVNILLCKLDSSSEEYAAVCEALSCIKQVVIINTHYSGFSDDAREFEKAEDTDTRVHGYDNLGELLKAFPREQYNVYLSINKAGNLVLKQESPYDSYDYYSYHPDSIRDYYLDTVRIKDDALDYNVAKSVSNNKILELYNKTEPVDCQLIYDLINDTIDKTKKEKKRDDLSHIKS